MTFKVTDRNKKVKFKGFLIFISTSTTLRFIKESEAENPRVVHLMENRDFLMLFRIACLWFLSSIQKETLNWRSNGEKLNGRYTYLYPLANPVRSRPTFKPISDNAI